MESKKYSKLVNTTKKETDSQYRELVVTSGERKGRGNISVGEWEVQTIGCKIGYRDILYNTGKISNIS